jgi:hypothetical protein
MKIASIVLGVVGLLVMLAGVAGRFYGAPTLTVLGCAHNASSVILVGVAIMVTAIWTRGLFCQQPK